MLIQIPGPTECSLIGFCGNAAQVGPPAGLMYLALGLVAAGVWGLWNERKRPAAVGRRPEPADDRDSQPTG